MPSVFQISCREMNCFQNLGSHRTRQALGGDAPAPGPLPPHSAVCPPPRAVPLGTAQHVALSGSCSAETMRRTSPRGEPTLGTAARPEELGLETVTTGSRCPCGVRPRPPWPSLPVGRGLPQAAGSSGLRRQAPSLVPFRRFVKRRSKRGTLRTGSSPRQHCGRFGRCLCKFFTHAVCTTVWTCFLQIRIYVPRCFSHRMDSRDGHTSAKQCEGLRHPAAGFPLPPDVHSSVWPDGHRRVSRCPEAS